MKADLSCRSAAKTDGNAFPVFILGWTIGGARASRLRRSESSPNAEMFVTGRCKRRSCTPLQERGGRGATANGTEGTLLCASNQARHPSAILNFHAFNGVGVKVQKLKPPHTTKPDDLIRSGRGVEVVSIGSPRGAGVVGPIAAAQNIFAIRA